MTATDENSVLVLGARFNTQRPHQALDWKTPAEYRAERMTAREGHAQAA